MSIYQYSYRKCLQELIKQGITSFGQLIKPEQDLLIEKLLEVSINLGVMKGKLKDRIRKLRKIGNYNKIEKEEKLFRNECINEINNDFIALISITESAVKNGIDDCPSSIEIDSYEDIRGK